MILALDRPRILSRLALANLEVASSDSDFEKIREQQRTISELEVRADREFRTLAMESWIVTRRRLRFHRGLLGRMMEAMQDGRSLDTVSTELRQ